MNAYETESVQQQFELSGYVIVPFAPGADIYVINTCTVTNIADRKSRQMLHKSRKMNPDAVVVAMGCYVQTAEGEEREIDPVIDLVVGNHQKKDVVRLVEGYLEGEQTDGGLVNMNEVKEYENLSLSRTAEHTRAYIKIQDGCNQFCSYCIIPYVRGRVRSRRKEEILSEVEGLAANGYQEVVLTGIHISSYGVDLETDDLMLLLWEYIR